MGISPLLLAVIVRKDLYRFIYCRIPSFKVLNIGRARCVPVSLLNHVRRTVVDTAIGTPLLYHVRTVFDTAIGTLLFLLVL